MAIRIEIPRALLQRIEFAAIDAHPRPRERK